MKKLLFIVFMAVGLLMCLSVSAEEIEVSLTCEIRDNSGIYHKPSRGTGDIPSVCLDGHTLYINSSHPD